MTLHPKHLFILLFLFLVGCGEEEKVAEKFIRPVKYQQIGLSSNQQINTYSGTAQTDKIINLSFRSSGIITKFDIKLGLRVKKGELLAKLDNVQARLGYEQAVNQRNSAQSQMNTAKSSLDRIRTLYEKGSSSLSDFEAAKNGYNTASESYQSAVRGVSLQQEQMKFGYLYAPEDGIISSIISEIDENISPGQTVATLNAGSTMEITIGLPESVVNSIHTGMETKINFPSIPDMTFNGTVTEVAPAVDSNSSTYPVKVTIKEPGETIKSGMAANVSFDFSSEESSEEKLYVPAAAVGEDSNGNFVFVIVEMNDSTIVKKQQIQIGNLTSQGFEISSGLDPGQKIATAGLQTLLDGQEVKLLQNVSVE